MTTELTKAAQQALVSLADELANFVGADKTQGRFDIVERVLTQRPAAQTEREADGLPLIVAGAIFDFAGFMTTRAEVIEVGSTAEAGPVADLVKEWAELRGLDLADAAVLSWQLHINRASLPAPQQATPEPLTLGPLAKRNIYDAIRGAYDLGYNDARNARTVPGDSAPGYDGRSVEEDHGGALFNLLSKRLTPATPEPVGEPVAWRWMPSHVFPTWVYSDDQNRVADARRFMGDGGVQALYTRPAPGVPEGFALVPVEPTPQMTTLVEHDMWDKPFVNGADVWSAVLAAAQAKGGEQ